MLLSNVTKAAYSLAAQTKRTKSLTPDMRIAIFAPVFVRPTETFIYDATKELAGSGANIVVVAEARQGADERPFDPICVVPRTARTNWQRIFRRLRRRIIRQPADDTIDVIQQARIRVEFTRFEPDVILANYGHGGVVVAPAAQKLGIPLVVSFHGADASRRARDPEWQRKYRDMFKIASAVTGPSDYVCRKLVALGCPPDRVHKLHYGIRTDRIEFQPADSRYDGGAVRFLFVGRLSPKKDPLTLLKSFDRARAELKPLPVCLTIVGDGPLRPEVEALVGKLDLGKNVKLLGHQSHDTVLQQYQSAHIYVQHSVTAPDGDEEGLPVSITEALAAGLPVISTRHSGIPEVVHHGENGYLVEEGDFTKMAEYMVTLAKNPDSWMQFGRAGRRLLEEQFAMPIVQAQLRKLLSHVSGKLFDCPES